MVCGYSLEVNATSDIDFYLSMAQIHLLSNIYKSNFSPLLNEFSATPSPGLTGKRRREGNIQGEELNFHDSGVESDTSTMNTVMSKTGNVPAIVKAADSAEEKASENGLWSDMTAFDVLLTAGKISFMVYSNDELVYRNLVPEALTTAHSKPKPTKADLELKALSPKSPSPVSDMCTTKLWPFLYVYFSQPHTLISCIPKTNQKLELSCFDMVLKGAKPGVCIEEEGKVIPDAGDFTMHWLETRPGKAQPKTGIPPSLYTFRVTDFLQHQGES